VLVAFAFMRLCVYEGGLFSVTGCRSVPPPEGEPHALVSLEGILAAVASGQLSFHHPLDLDLGNAFRKYLVVQSTGRAAKSCVERFRFFHFVK
jgi:hypothetical protein